jgi:hypothetical protein
MTDPSYMDFDDSARYLFDAWREARAAAEKWSDRAEELGSTLMERMGDSTHGTIDGRHVVTRVAPGTTSRFDTARFRDTQPDLYADYVVPQYRAGHLRLAAQRRGR